MANQKIYSIKFDIEIHDNVHITQHYLLHTHTIMTKLRLLFGKTKMIY